MKPHTFNLFNPISIIGLLNSFKVAFYTNGIHEGEDMCLLIFFISETAFAVLNPRLRVGFTYKKHSRSACERTKNFNTYPHMNNFSMKQYVADEVIEEISSEIKSFA